ncbi:MAG: hypothetical protein ACR2PL_00900 [Dehalococcoidia bacterium]
MEWERAMDEVLAGPQVIELGEEALEVVELEINPLIVLAAGHGRR